MRVKNGGREREREREGKCGWRIAEGGGKRKEGETGGGESEEGGVGVGCRGLEKRERGGREEGREGLDQGEFRGLLQVCPHVRARTHVRT